MAHTEEVYLGKKEYQVLGKRPVRHDGADKVTGKAIYTADIQLPNMAHGAIVRSPHAHARVRSIDASEAMTIPGVFAVVTAADFPNLDNKHALMGEAGQVGRVRQAAGVNGQEEERKDQRRHHLRGLTERPQRGAAGQGPHLGGKRASRAQASTASSSRRKPSLTAPSRPMPPNSPVGHATVKIGALKLPPAIAWAPRP